MVLNRRVISPGGFIFEAMITVYAIKSNKRNYIYVGMTNNLCRRFSDHNK
ncbi:MAG: GIY-YIG nuclease family protein, partial [Flavobacteriaceae bacterium]|nr:GIY-YIG nuclease family protein [Flavobacteriaceae bacterium]